MWIGADPGGKNRFGIAILYSDGKFKSDSCSSFEEAFEYVLSNAGGQTPAAVGLDCPLWWSVEKGGSREVDRWLRTTHKIHPGTVLSANALKGAVLVQGLLLARRMREKFPEIEITETHPKALLKAFPGFCSFPDGFGLSGQKPSDEHQRDALIGAFVAREGSVGRWKNDLAVTAKSTSDVHLGLFGDCHYWWPSNEWLAPLSEPL